MTHQYNVSGMTCAGCQAKVQKLLSDIPGVTAVSINLQEASASISMERHIATSAMQDVLKPYPKYQLSEMQNHVSSFTETADENVGWFKTYKPILLIFVYITLISGWVSFSNGGFAIMQFARIFMSGFFLTFSFFKMLNLNGFAESYAMYDIIAKKIKGWGIAYAFIELILGIAYAIDFMPLLTGTVTFVVMSVSIAGVLQSVFNKRHIQCACLGTVFNLPMSTVTIIEDGLMIAMSTAMVFALI